MNALNNLRARATSAAPPYFKVFRNPRTGSGYLDGAFYYNNPVRVANLERKLIWPDTEHMHPDILVSIRASLDHSTSASDTEHFSISSVLSNVTGVRSEGPQKRPALRRFPQFNNMLNVLLNRADNILNTELVWSSFMIDIKPSKDHAQRYQRLNPIISYKPPALDEVHEMEKLQVEAFNAMRRGAQNSMARKVAHRLIASSFFFLKSSVRSTVDETVMDANS